MRMQPRDRVKPIDERAPRKKSEPLDERTMRGKRAIELKSTKMEEHTIASRKKREHHIRRASQTHERAPE
jgi:hypothetical protein